MAIFDPASTTPTNTFVPPDLLNSVSFSGAGSPFGAQVGGGVGNMPSWMPTPAVGGPGGAAYPTGGY